LSSAGRSTKARYDAWQNRAKQPSLPESPVQPESDSLDPAIFRTRDVLQLLAISRRQLQYWAQTNLVRPSIRTQGGHHRYTFEDLIALKAAKRLIDAGVSVQRIRSSIQALREILPEVAWRSQEITLVATGDVLLVLSEGSDVRAIRGGEWIFRVGDFRRELDAWRALHTPRRVKRAKSADQNKRSLKGA
jgi:DNA-binding transcriptional MerR regulator